MHEKPASFFKAFKPFSKESNKQTTHLNLRTDRAVVTDQAEVANLLADYFTSVASNIGGDNVNSLKENDHQEHQTCSQCHPRVKAPDKWPWYRLNYYALPLVSVIVFLS